MEFMKVTVLIVDDAVELREVIAEQLSTRTSEVLQAGDGIEALEILSQQSVQLIVSDLQMPRLSGAGLIRALRSRNSKIPIFLMTGASEAPDQDLERLGATAFFRKPHHLLELCTAVKKAIASLQEPKEMAEAK
jgi:CheY-like chemotaxis protein